MVGFFFSCRRFIGFRYYVGSVNLNFKFDRDKMVVVRVLKECYYILFILSSDICLVKFFDFDFGRWVR